MKKKLLKIRCERLIMSIVCIVILLCITLHAHGLFDNPLLTWNSDYTAYTTSSGDTDIEWYEEGTRVYTGVTSSLGALSVGEHYYSYSREGTIPIGYWEVAYKGANCCHNSYPEDGFMGISFGREPCFEQYYSGWFPYCADCDELVVFMLHYMDDVTAKSITSAQTGLVYYYLCPFCSNLEQGAGYSAHTCKEISKNQYSVSYQANGGTGHMANSIHMYDNATMYEGKTIEAQTQLSKNGYQRIGYKFVGWNTKADGAGTSYVDQQVILNLSHEEGAVITLYAQWELTYSYLHIDANGGTYEGEAIREIRAAYGSTYTLVESAITSPEGYSVNYVSNGGSAVATSYITKQFAGWEVQVGFQGAFYNSIYTFLGEENSIDTIKAQYIDGALTLPTTSRTNYVFGGWYTTPACEEGTYIGMDGDVVYLSKDTTLYAKWVDLVLVAKDNYTANESKGAVDLSWNALDGLAKYYEVFQSLNQTTWEQIYSYNSIGSSVNISQSYTNSNRGTTYTVPYTGYYLVSANGAQGASYGSYSGGKGAILSAEYWLQQGDVITFYVGSTGSSSSGGSNGLTSAGSNTSGSGSGGGAATEVYITRNGSTEALLIAGGGGGANAGYSGGGGGLLTTTLGSKAGTSGSGGGGSGAVGGSAGSYTAGSSITSMKLITNQTLSLYGRFAQVAWGDYNTYTYNTYGTESINGTTYTKLLRTNGSTVYTPLSYQDLTSLNFGTASFSNGVLSYYWTTHSGGICHTSTYGYHSVKGVICNGTLSFYDKSVTTTNPTYSQSKGGSSYINTSYGTTNIKNQSSTQTGNGTASIVGGSQIGYLEQTSLNNVFATDLAKPDPITDYEIIVNTNTTGVLEFVAPMDQGTTYYHNVVSYKEIQYPMKEVATSNMTKNTLTSGIKGYYYKIDSSATTTIVGTETYTTSRSINLSFTDTTSWLHIASVDVANNISDTIHIALSKTSDEILWPISSNPIEITGTDNNVYLASEKLYYIRADGTTEFLLSAGGSIDGTARQDYQINEISLAFQALETGEISSYLVSTTMQENLTYASSTYGSDQIVRTYMESIPVVDRLGSMLRNEYGKTLTLNQAFLLPIIQDGKRIEVVPSVAIQTDDFTITSDNNKDTLEAVIIIGDATSPTITGVDVLQELLIHNTNKSNRTFYASDSGSGLKSFQAIVTNTDHKSTQTFESINGAITLPFAEDMSIFVGDFTVEFIAIDQVGNTRVETAISAMFALETSIERILEPHEAIFQKGESGILYVTVYGYPDKVEITFPESLSKEEEESIIVYEYNPKSFLCEESIEFMIPIEAESQMYQIKVTAYKDTAKLEDYPELAVLEVDGTILDDIKTRLR
ncbi:MAG: InlB B-repeat-containing protein [Lachnospiraceae bacterium]